MTMKIKVEKALFGRMGISSRGIFFAMMDADSSRAPEP
jgi:hypothetical protein